MNFMDGHLAICVDRLIASAVLENSISLRASSPVDTCKEVHTQDASAMENNTAGESFKTAAFEWKNEAESGIAECRICQEEDEIANLEAPCTCSGSLKYAHHKCVQRWCDEKGDTQCEICQQPYKDGYTARSLSITRETVSITVGDDWEITGGHQLDIHDPRIFAIAAEHHFSGTEHEDYPAASANGAACCRTAVVILMAFLLLRHALSMTVVAADDDPSTFLSLFLLRAAGFFLPCYIMVRALTLLQRRRQQQEAAMAILLQQAGQGQGLRFTVSPPTSAGNGSPQSFNSQLHMS